jgi:nitrate reductase gamma subunit
MEGWIEFGRGPLFRFTLCVMVLGLARLIALTAIAVFEAYGRNPDGIVPWRPIARQTLGWLLPLRRLWHMRPVYSLASVLFHVGILAVPVFLPAHLRLWRGAAGFAWPALPQGFADWLTLLTIATGAGLFFGRVLFRSARVLSRPQDYAWPPLLVLIFVTGYTAVHGQLSPRLYQETMFVHVYSADLVLVLMPFTKLAHCVLVPFSQAVTAVAWKFVPGAGERVAATLGYEERPVWVANARSSGPARIVDEEKKEVCAR